MENNSDIRNNIILKAAEVFSAYGYRKTRMDDIAKMVGKGKSSLYYYFKNKDEVFKAVVEYEAQILRNEILQSVEMLDDPIDKVKSYILTRMHVYKRVANFYKALTNDGLLHLAFVEGLRKDYERQEVGLLSRILEDGREKGQLRIKDSALSAVAIVTALRGLELPLFNSDDQSMIARLDQLLELLFYGIVKRHED